MKAFVAIFSLVFPLVTSAAPQLRYTAKVYALDDPKKTTLLYSYRSESEPIGDEVIVNNRFNYPDGRPATHEEITFIKDKTIRLYKQEQFQMNAQGLIEVAAGKAKFTWKKDGKEKTSTEDAGPDFIIGSQIPLQFEDHWAELMKGDKLKRRLAVLDRQETIGFEFSKESDSELDGKKVVIIKMKPSSFIISALVNPLHFYVTPDGSSLLEIHGRTTVKRDVNGRLKDLDAIITYEKGPAADQPTQAPVSAAAPKSGGNSK